MILTDAMIDGMMRDAAPAVMSLCLAILPNVRDPNALLLVVHHVEDGPFSYPPRTVRTSGMCLVTIADRWQTFRTQAAHVPIDEFGARVMLGRIPELPPPSHVTCFVVRRTFGGIVYAIRHTPTPTLEGKPGG